MSGPTLLVTGFGPFPGAPENPTADLIAALKEEGWSPPGVHLETATLPVRFDMGEAALLPLLARHRPAGAVAFGLSAKARGFTLERIARNLLDPARRDTAGNVPTRICPEPMGPATRASSLPLAAIHHRLARAGLPVSWSDDAGGYVCNLAFHALARHFAPSGGPAGFIHVPYTDEQAARLNPGGPSLSPAELVAGAKIALAATAELIA